MVYKKAERWAATTDMPSAGSTVQTMVARRDAQSADTRVSSWAELMAMRKVAWRAVVKVSCLAALSAVDWAASKDHHLADSKVVMKADRTAFVKVGK